MDGLSTSKAKEILEECAKNAKAVVAWGSCASNGCVQAAKPNPTGATPIHKVIGKPVINVPGCPPIADVMTADGTVRAIGRHGVSGEKSSVLSRAAFEITVNHLLLASQRGESDELNGVAENIIVGQPVNLGTGAIELVMSPKKPKKKGK